MSELIQVIVLGLVQGIAEFLPISSSGHLVLLGHWMDMQRDQLGLAIWLHVGTLAATCVVYYHEIFQLLRGDKQLAAAIAVAMVPSGIIGLTCKSYLEAVFDNPLAVAICLVITALILVVGEWLFRWNSRSEEHVGLASAAAVGFAQATALLPGISRSGVTIAAGLACGVRREAAARFSFLLAIPTIAGAALVETVQSLRAPGLGTPPLHIVVGTAVAFLAGVASLKGLILLLRRYPLYLFSGYCLLLGGGVLASYWSPWA